MRRHAGAIGVVQVDGGLARAAYRLHGAPDQVLARLGQHHDVHIGRNPVFLDQHADEVEIGLRRRREGDLDLLQPHLHQLLEEAQLARGVHRLDQGLVAVAQVGAHPARRAW